MKNFNILRSRDNSISPLHISLRFKIYEGFFFNVADCILYMKFLY